MASEDPPNRRVVEQVLVGVATRPYARSLEPLPATMVSRGTSKSAVSRRFVAKTAAQLATWRSTALDGLDLVAPLVDGVHIGEHCIIVAQTGVAGSTKVGNYVVIGGQAGIAGHLHIGNQVQVAAQSGVMHNIPDGEKWFGTPAQPDRQTKRQILALQKLPELLRRVAELEKKPGVKPGI